MRRKALLILACLALSETLGEPEKPKVNLVDNIANESGSHLYRHVPAVVYASAAPYAAYSFHAPGLATAPRDMQLVPVNRERVVIQNTNGFLTDSYGKFAETPQMVGFKTTLPQQFVRLQDLPLHLSQPLVSGTPGAQQGAQHFFAPTQFNVHGFQAPGSSPFARYAVPQHVVHNANTRNFASFPVQQNNFTPHPVVQQQPSSNKSVFVNLQSVEQQSNGPKFQRLQESPRNSAVAQEHKNSNLNNPQPLRVDKEQLQAAPAKVTTYVNGKKTVLSLETRPPLPLLDISLLEPLTFDNPLVPQVQHFLPRINEATYHSLHDYNANNKKQHKSGQLKPKSKESGVVRNKPKSKQNINKKKQPRPQYNENEDDHQTPDITMNETPNASPEISHEIKSPNYKETYKEQVISYNKEMTSKPVTYNYNKEEQSQPINYSYNKETRSEPIQYTYEKQVQSKPVHYSYEHNSRAPQQENQAHNKNREQDPKQLTYTSKDENKNEEQSDHVRAKQPVISIELPENSSEDDIPKQPQSPQNTYNIQRDQYSNAPQPSHQLVPEHRQVTYNQKNLQDESHIDNHEFPKSFMDLVNSQIKHRHYHAGISKNNNHNNQLPAHRPNEHIRVDPEQHIHNQQPDRPQETQQSGGQHRKHHDDYVRNSHTYEKPKGGREFSEGNNNENQNRQPANEEEDKEENFERAYKNAAFGFPGYERNSEEIEKDIYNPEAYAIARENDNFDFEHAPFQQYYEESDKFPKETHSSYKDSRDKVKEDYFLGFTAAKPESINDRHINKQEYFEMYKQHKPENYFSAKRNENENEEHEKQNAKYSAIPYYYDPEEKPKQQFARYHAAAAPTVLYEFDYTKETPRDNTARDSQPFQRFKTKTQFVEPQFQYGFEPSSLPYLLDSELSPMASNVRLESEKPGARKKMYKENWYITKSSTSGGSNKS
ncbi:GATA zinc finger domain-containing protein 14-like [Papilio machaon]|uniref:GATA zinc finger domain-containing protein 14-like n=1 Tax=Papilio machaon TaxID=76193 RepID=UPI001E664406|nr:GATA zinc finger domain-containing protein 14-like [Papilio machaon]